MTQIEKAESTLKQMLTLMSIDAGVNVSENDERITLEITGEHTSALIGKKGRTLDAMQFLVNKISSRMLGEDEGKPITLDAEGYRARRAEALIELAHKVAEKAKTTGKPVELDYMSAADRRIVHVTLADVPGVRTESEGEGMYRHLVVFPVKDA